MKYSKNYNKVKVTLTSYLLVQKHYVGSFLMSKDVSRQFHSILPLLVVLVTADLRIILYPNQ